AASYPYYYGGYYGPAYGPYYSYYDPYYDGPRCWRRFGRVYCNY
ncbi:MAG: BA14K family protein, partial [Phycisphaerae bacterium]|nr:BA14K family protein [Phycisphaerae bacterium]